MEKSYKEQLSKITTFILDIDGVLTSGSVLVSNEGDLLRTMSVRDGFILKMAILHGYRVAVITGGNNLGARQRLYDLGIKDVFMEQHYKFKCFTDYIKTNNLSYDEVLYVGDDIPDIPPLKKAGLAVCPQDATMEVKNVCDYISHLKGGYGCVRDIIEQVMKVQGKWDGIVNRVD